MSVIITDSKNNNDLTNAMAFVCKAAKIPQKDSIIDQKFNGVLFVRSTEDTVTAYATDGCRLHHATFTNAQIEYFGMQNCVVNRDDDFNKVEFVLHTKTKWVLEEKLSERTAPNVFKVIPNHTTWTKIEYLYLNDKKFGIISNFNQSIQLSNNIPISINPQYILDLETGRFSVSEIYISSEWDSIDNLRYGTNRTPIVVKLKDNSTVPDFDMTAVIMPMVYTGYNKNRVIDGLYDSGKYADYFNRDWPEYEYKEGM